MPGDSSLCEPWTIYGTSRAPDQATGQVSTAMSGLTDIPGDGIGATRSWSRWHTRCFPGRRVLSVGVSEGRVSMLPHASLSIRSRQVALLVLGLVVLGSAPGAARAQETWITGPATLAAAGLMGFADAVPEAWGEARAEAEGGLGLEDSGEAPEDDPDPQVSPERAQGVVKVIAKAPGVLKSPLKGGVKAVGPKVIHPEGLVADVVTSTVGSIPQHAGAMFGKSPVNAPTVYMGSMTRPTGYLRSRPEVTVPVGRQGVTLKIPSIDRGGRVDFYRVQDGGEYAVEARSGGRTWRLAESRWGWDWNEK